MAGLMMQGHLLPPDAVSVGVAVIPVDLLRRLVAAAPASLRAEPQVAILAAELGLPVADAPRKGIDPDWLTHAVACVRRAAERAPAITSDDVWPLLKLEPPDPRALGHAFTAAARAGYIEITERSVPSNRSRHDNGRPKRIWRSLIV